jgi:bacterioferritin
LEAEWIMQGDAKVIEYLNKGLRHELTAINQYWLHYRLLNNWGLLEMAKTWRKESIEEMEHADKFTDRILFLDGFPNMQVLDPLRIGQNVKEIIECDLAAEISARNLYQEAATYCHGVKDYVSRDLFESLMKDEEHHIDFLETQLDLIGRIGLELYTQKHVGGLESEHYRYNTHGCHHPPPGRRNAPPDDRLQRVIQYSRDVSGRAERLRRTGYLRGYDSIGAALRCFPYSCVL